MDHRALVLACWVLAPPVAAGSADVVVHEGPARISESGCDASQSDADWLGVRVQDPSVALLIRHALNQATAVLRGPRCQALFTEFRDQRGRLLAEGLAALATDAPTYLGWIQFHDGSEGRPCRNGSGALAYAEPGSRIVRVCSRAIERGGWQEPDYLTVIVIHEMFHTLGMGENPPTTEEISARIRKHCWLGPS